MFSATKMSFRCQCLSQHHCISMSPMRSGSSKDMRSCPPQNVASELAIVVNWNSWQNSQNGGSRLRCISFALMTCRLLRNASFRTHNHRMSFQLSRNIFESFLFCKDLTSSLICSFSTCDSSLSLAWECDLTSFSDCSGRSTAKDRSISTCSFSTCASHSLDWLLDFDLFPFYLCFTFVTWSRKKFHFFFGLLL